MPKGVYSRRKKVVKKVRTKRVPVVQFEGDPMTMAEAIADAQNRVALEVLQDPFSDPVNSPDHYTIGGIETIDFIEAKKLNYHLGQVVKYVSRASYKDNFLEDLKKARWYLNREIQNRS